MKETVLIIGGCRSGKSRYALATAEQVAGESKIFIATLVPQDEEMEVRIRRHQKERSPNWRTIEIPLHLPEAINEHSPKASVIVVDCLTLWLNNLLMENDDLEQIRLQIQNLTQTLKAAHCPVYLVSNEVGSGIVPENRMARIFRDIAGDCNQQVATCADRVVWMVAGVPVSVK